MVLGNNAMAMYVNSMEEWGERFAPAPGDMEWHSLFAESLSNPDQYNYHLDVLCSGTEAEQRAFFLEMKEVIRNLDEREQKWNRESAARRPA